MTEIAIPESTVHIAARNSEELAAAKQHMSHWFAQKVGEVTEELHLVEVAAKYAKDHKWNHSALDGQAYRIRKRRDFYEKVLAAVDAGYTLVPDIPIDLFAIRVQREKPNGPTVDMVCKTDWEKANNTADRYLAKEKPDVLMLGEGTYTNPEVKVTRDAVKEVVDGKEQLHKFTTPVAFSEFEFPIIAAHPAVMNATQEAMAKRIFDQIGVSPRGRKRGDPLIIGQVCLRQGWSTKTVSFLIGWNINLKTL